MIDCRRFVSGIFGILIAAGQNHATQRFVQTVILTDNSRSAAQSYWFWTALVRM